MLLGTGIVSIAVTPPRASLQGVMMLYAALWLKDLEHLYAFITGTLAELNVDSVDTVLIGHAVKRPGRGAF